jgi:hypothetical protein
VQDVEGPVDLLDRVEQVQGQAQVSFPEGSAAACADASTAGRGSGP